MPLAAGTRLGPYEIGSPIGKGGMGEVYRARDSKLRREVAIKPFPNIEDRIWQVSRDGGRAPLWSRNGRELFYGSPDHLRQPGDPH